MRCSHRSRQNNCTHPVSYPNEQHSRPHVHDEIHNAFRNFDTIVGISSTWECVAVYVLRDQPLEMSGVKKEFDDGLVEFRVTYHQLV